jgi:hypothetical protein
MSEKVAIKCGKCGHEYSVHAPILIPNNTPFVSSLTLIPSWSIEERRCPECRAVNGPALMPEARYAWAAFDVPEDSRIVIPSAQVPRDFKVVVK